MRPYKIQLFLSACIVFGAIALVSSITLGAIEPAAAKKKTPALAAEPKIRSTTQQRDNTPLSPLGSAGSSGRVDTVLEPCTTAAFAQSVILDQPLNFRVFGDIASGDLNGDGNQDLLVNPIGDNLFGVLQGGGNGRFGLATVRDVRIRGENSLAIIHDMNVDGNPEAIVGTDNALLITYQGGPFGPRYADNFMYYAQRRLGAVIPGDVDSDGIPDLVITNQTHGDFQIAKGENGSYSNPYFWPLTENFAPSPEVVALRDVNGDGKLDFLSAGSRLHFQDFREWSLSTLLGDGMAGFWPAAGSPLALSAPPQSLKIHDFNQDHKLDALITFQTDPRVLLFLGNGDGAFGPAPSTTLDVGFLGAISGVGDFNLDGNLDAVLVGGNPLTSVVLLGDGAGKFTRREGPDFGIEAMAPVRVVVDDFKNDQKPDFAVLTLERDGTEYRMKVWLHLATCPLSVTVDAPEQVTAGKRLRYDITVRNISASRTLENVRLIDGLPENLSLAQATVTRGSCTPFSPVHCDLGSLAPGRAGAFHIEADVAPAATQPVINLARVVATGGTDLVAEIQTTTRVAYGPDLELSVRTSPSNVVRDANFSYLLKIVNVGTQTARNVSLIDTLPAEVSFLSAPGCSHSGAATGGIVTCSLGDIPAESSLEKAIAVVASAAQAAVSLSNSAMVSAADSVDPYPANNEITLATPVSNAGPQPANASFESGLLPPWETFRSGTVQVVPNLGRLGDKSLRLGPGAGVSTVVGGLTSGQPYLISAWVNSAQAVQVYLAADDSSGQAYVQDGPRLVGSSSWFRMDVLFQATASRAVRLFLASTDSVEDSFWDDIEIRPVQRVLVKVPEDVTTIQGAIDQARDGDTIEVAAGTYTENVDFKGKGVHLKGASRSERTVLQAGQPGWVVSFTSGESPLAVLEGITVRGGEGGILIVASAPTIRGNTIEGNRGPGVSATGSSAALVGNTIRNNQAFRGAGVLVLSGGITLMENLIEDNCACDSSVSSGGGLYLGTSLSRVERNVIQHNQTLGEGGGIVVGGSAFVAQNVIRGNKSAEGGGISLRSGDGGSVDVSGNLIVQNEGGGMLLSSSGGEDRQTRIVQNTIADNRGAGVLSKVNVGQLAFVNNIIAAAHGHTAVSWPSQVTPSFRSNNVFSPSGLTSDLLPDMTGQDGNISADPLFRNPRSRDYHLSAGSASIDAGADLPDLPVHGLDSQPRRVDGNGDGIAIPDMGALEYQPGQYEPPRSTRSRTGAETR